MKSKSIGLTIRNCFIDEIPKEVIDTLQRCTDSPRRKITGVDIPIETLTTGVSNWLHAVEARRDTNSLGDPVFIIRVITEIYGGVNVTLPLDSELMRERYLALRLLIRNTDFVSVTFKGLSVSGSPRPREIFFKASDFKVFDPKLAEQLNDPVPDFIV